MLPGSSSGGGGFRAPRVGGGRSQSRMPRAQRMQHSGGLPHSNPSWLYTGRPPDSALAGRSQPSAANPFGQPPAPGSETSGPLRTGPTPGGSTTGTPGTGWTRGAPAGSSGSSAPGGSSGSGGPPLDATALSNIAANQFRVNQQTDTLNLKGSQASTSLQDTLAQLAYQQPRADLGLEQRYNNAGGLYSSVYGDALGNLNQQYATKNSDANRRYSDTMASIANQIAGLQGGIPYFNNQQAAGSVGRESQIAANTPPPLPPAPTAPKNAGPNVGGGHRGSGKSNNRVAKKMAGPSKGRHH